MGRLRAVAALVLVACGRPPMTIDPLFMRPGDVLCGAGCTDDACRFACPTGLDCYANGTGPSVCLTSEVACRRIDCAPPKDCVSLLSEGPTTIGCTVDR